MSVDSLNHTLLLYSYSIIISQIDRIGNNKKQMTEGDRMNSINSSCLFPKQAAAADDDDSCSKDHGSNSNTLIVLDQHDFHLDKTKKKNGGIKVKVSNKKDVDTRKKLLLLKIPKGLDMFDSFQEQTTKKKKNSGTGNDTTAAGGAAGRGGGAGGCYVLSNSNGSTLICNNHSYQMSIVGTSNALVLVPPPSTQGQSSSTSTKSDDDDNPSPIKKLKFTTTTTASSSSPTKKSTPTTTMTGRLVHVGGSGASFIELKSKTLPSANDIMSIFRSNHHHHKHKNNNMNDLSVISLQLQCSVQELLHVLQHVPSVVAYPSTTSSSSSSSGSGGTGTGESSYSYIMLDESQVYDVYNAILSTLCEASCCMNHYTTGTTADGSMAKLGQIPVEDTVTEIVQRLQQEEFKVLTNASADDGSDGGGGIIGIDGDKDELLLLRHIARHLLYQLRRSTSTESDDKDDKEHNTPKKDNMVIVKEQDDDEEEEGMMTLDAEKVRKINTYFYIKLTLLVSDVRFLGSTFSCTVRVFNPSHID